MFFPKLFVSFSYVLASKDPSLLICELSSFFLLFCFVLICFVFLLVCSLFYWLDSLCAGLFCVLFVCSCFVCCVLFILSLPFCWFVCSALTFNRFHTVCAGIFRPRLCTHTYNRRLFPPFLPAHNYRLVFSPPQNRSGLFSDREAPHRLMTQK